MLDILYIVGLAVVWAGNFCQIRKVVKNKSAKDISLVWAFALVISIAIRSARAILSTYWVWGTTYIVSLVIALIFLGVVLYFKRKYPNGVKK